MKLNLEFYNKESEDNISEIDKEIIEKYINNYDEQDYENILFEDSRLEIVLALSEIRKNIINWYPFKEGSDVLEIGGNLGEITGELCERCNRVITIEENKKKAEAIAKRHKNKENLEIIAGNLSNIKIKEEFDYIILIGYLEKVEKIEETLKILKGYLKNSGKILVAIDNSLGLKYFSRTNLLGENITKIVGRNLYKREELLNKIEIAGFNNQNIYYPMPDYKMANVVFSDKRPLTKNDLSRNIPYYDSKTIKFYDENQVYRKVLEEDGSNTFEFANSFFIEIFNGEYEENKIQFVAFSNMRKKMYRIKTIMEKDYVYKYSINEISKKHIDDIKENIEILRSSNVNTLDSYDNNKIISRYTEEKTLDEIIINMVKEGEMKKAIDLIQRFKNEIENKFERVERNNNVFDKYNIEYKDEDIEDIEFIKYGLWDLIFQNCFYINNEFYFYDQEWKNDNIPVDFIIYRAIKYFDRIKKYISEEELYEIVGLNRKKIDLYNELDNCIQEEIRDDLIWKLYNQGTDVFQIKTNELTAIHNRNLIALQMNEKDKQIEELKKQLSDRYNSNLWKIKNKLSNMIKKKQNKKGKI